MSLVERPSLVEKARRAFGIIQQGFGSTVSDEIVPVVILDDVTGPDVLATGYPRFAIGNPQVAAVALENSMCIFRNPTGSGVRCFVEHVTVSLETAGVFTVRRAPFGLLTLLVSSSREWADWRLSPGNNPAATLATDTAVGQIGERFVSIRTPNDSGFDLPLGITIDPGGDDIVIADPVVNQALEAVFWWRESAIEGGQ